MIYFHEKGIELIKKASNGAKEGLICTPYYSERGLQLLDPFFDTAEKVEFWTRFSPLDWKAGVADMAALNKRIKSVLHRKKEFDIRISDDLHAKIYNFSNDTVIIGSANLTWSAMTNNIEIVCQLTDKEAAISLDFLSSLRDHLTHVTAETFSDYVAVAADAISKPDVEPLEEDAEMNAAIELAEEVFRKALTSVAPEAPQLRQMQFEKFIEYCRYESTDVSREVIARYEGKHNLQGHVKHCFFGSFRFLSEFPQFINQVAATPVNSLYDLTDTTVNTQWRNFLLAHSNEIDKERSFSFHTLRVYLPPSLGGICSGGGGGSGTLKRVLPLVARMLSSLRYKNGKH